MYEGPSKYQVLGAEDDKWEKVIKVKLRKKHMKQV